MSVAALRFCARLGMPFDQWRPLVVVPLLVPSHAILVGHVFVVVGLQRASATAEAAAEEVLSFYLAVTASMLSTVVWLVSMARVHTQANKDLEPPPKPQVTPFVVRDAGSECTGSACAICLEELSSGCLAGRLPCNHVFHESCIRGWLATTPFQACPMRCAGVFTNLDSRPLESEPSTLGRGMEAI